MREDRKEFYRKRYTKDKRNIIERYIEAHLQLLEALVNDEIDTIRFFVSLLK